MENKKPSMIESYKSVTKTAPPLLNIASATVSPAQCRAARGLLAWTQLDLARQTGLSKTAIVQFETGLARTRLETLHMIATAFGREGVEFMPPHGVNRKALQHRMFADQDALRQDWPAFLQQFGAGQTVELRNWPDFAQELQQLTGQSFMFIHRDVMPAERAAVVGDWLILPLLDTGYRIAMHHPGQTRP